LIRHGEWRTLFIASDHKITSSTTPSTTTQNIHTNLLAFKKKALEPLEQQKLLDSTSTTVGCAADLAGLLSTPSGFGDCNELGFPSSKKKF
jgi:hypothetical protein